MKQKLQIFFLDIFFGGREYKTKNAAKKTPFPFITVFLALVSTVLILCTIFSLIHISELSAEIASLKKQSVSLDIKKDSLENELDHRYSYVEIIESAKELGFSAEGGKVVYVEPDQEDGESENSEEYPS